MKPRARTYLIVLVCINMAGNKNSHRLGERCENLAALEIEPVLCSANSPELASFFSFFFFFF